MDRCAGAATFCTVILTKWRFTLFSASIAPSPVAIVVPFQACPNEDNAVLPKHFPVGIDVDESYYRFGNAFKSEKAEIIKEMARLAEGKKAKTEAAAAKKAAQAVSPSAKEGRPRIHAQTHSHRHVLTFIRTHSTDQESRVAL